MVRCLKMVSRVMIVIACAWFFSGCVQGEDQGNTPPGDEPAVQELSAPQLLTFFQPFTTTSTGSIFVTGILDIKGFNEVDLEITQSPGSLPNMTVNVAIGKLGGATLGQFVGTFALNASPTIRTFKVIGPELSVSISGGPPNTVVNLEAWLFLH